MRKSKYPEEQIVKVLRQVDAGAKVQDVVRRLGNHGDDLLPVEVKARRPGDQ